MKAAISNIGPELDRLLNTINDVNNLTTAFSNTIFEASYGVIGKEVTTGGSGTRSFTRNNIKWQCDKCVRLLRVSIEQRRERKYNNTEENKKRCTSSRNAFARHSAKCKKRTCNEKEQESHGTKT